MVLQRYTVNESADGGCDEVTPVSEAYESPGAFIGTSKRVMVDVSEAGLDGLADEIKTKLAMAS